MTLAMPGAMPGASMSCNTWRKRGESYSAPARVIPLSFPSHPRLGWAIDRPRAHNRSNCHRGLTGNRNGNRKGHRKSKRQSHFPASGRS